MYGSTSYGKIKNEKIMRWRMLLSEFDFEIVYRQENLIMHRMPYHEHIVPVCMTTR